MDAAGATSVPSVGPAWQPTMTAEAAGRKPKLAELFLKTHERKPQPLSGSHADFVETHFEVEDASSYVDALLAFEGIIDRLHYPNRHHVRMLISLCFFPLFFRPPAQSSDASLRASKRPKAPLKSASGRIASHADDPLVVSQRQIRQLARDLLADVIWTNGVEVICDGIKGYGMPERDPGPDSRVGSEEPVKPNGKYFTAKTSRLKLGEDHPDYEQPVETEDPLAEAANRILFADDLWDVLAGTTARKAQLRTSEKPLLPTAAWEVLRELVKGWEAEAVRKRLASGSEDPPEPLSLLRYFKPSASTGAARELSNKALDVIFWPFTEHDTIGDEDDGMADPESDSTAGPGSSDSGSDLEDLRGPVKRSRTKRKPKRKSTAEASAEPSNKREKLERDSMGILEKRETALRLFGLIGECATTGYLGSNTVVSEFTHRLKGLGYEHLLAFLETADASSPCPPFLSRLLWSFLETHSHPVSASALLRPDATPDTIEPDIPVSPRKLGAQASAASLNGSTSRSSSIASYWNVPGIDSADFIRIVETVPIEVPPLTKDKPAQRGVPQSFRRAEQAAEVHLVIKHLLASVLSDRYGGGGPTAAQQDRIGRAFASVDQVVDNARSRIAPS